jgi:Protein of unknown function (DUF4232)
MTAASTCGRLGMLAVMAGAAGLLTACGSGSPAPTAAKTVTQTIPATAASSGPAATPAVATTTGATPTAPAAAGPSTCLPSDLQASLGQGQGAAGTHYQLMVLTNTSGSACTLYGYPGISFVTGRGGTVIGAPASRNALIPDTLITLQPGGAASTLIGITDTALLPKCDPGHAGWLQIYPPGDLGSLFVQFSSQVCTRPGAKYMTVTAMHAGTTGTF